MDEAEGLPTALEGPLLPSLGLSSLAVASSLLLLGLLLRHASSVARHAGRELRAGRTPAARPPPPLAAKHALRLQIAAGSVAALFQLLTLLLRTHFTLRQPGEAAVMAASVGTLVGGLVLLPLLAPRACGRHRAVLAAAVRISFFLLPNITSTRAVTTQLQALPGLRWKGVVRDIWRLFYATRTFVLAVSMVVCPLPLLWSLPVSALAFWRCNLSVPHICGLQLLRHPTWQRSISWVHAAADVVLLTPPQRFLPAGRLSPSPTPAADCRVFITWLQLLVGGLIPAALVHRYYAPRGSQLVAAPASQQQRRQQQRRRRGIQQSAPGWRRALARACAWAQLAAHRVADGICLLFDLLAGRAGGSPALTAVAWLLAASGAWAAALWLGRRPDILA